MHSKRSIHARPWIHHRANESPGRFRIIHLTHQSGVQVTLGAIHDAYGSFGQVHAYGTKGEFPLKLADTYTAFRGQLLAFIALVKTGTPPIPFDQTVELMAIIIAGIRSREQSGRVVNLKEIFAEL